MADAVETTSRLARWRINTLITFPSQNLKSNSFKIGKWKWWFIVENYQNMVIIKLFSVSIDEDSLPIASFNIRVVSFLADRMTLSHPEIRDKLMTSDDYFVWTLEDSLPARSFVIELEFLDLKTSSPNGGEPCSIWSEGFKQKDMNSTKASLARMLSESIHTDIIICASDGSIGAHRAVLAARSPVFHSMFTHDLKEKDTSTINISDMSIEACKIFLSYIYSNLQYQDFLNNRFDLLKTADKYDISDLKDACEESLIEDIDLKNVLERVQYASMYKLPKLKVSCIQYLVKFGKICDIREEFNVFMRSADRELIGEVVNEILSFWKGF